MKKWIIITGSVVAVLILAILILPGLLDINRYRPEIQNKLRQSLQREVSLGEMEFTIMPFAFQARDVSIGEDPACKTGRPFATAGRLLVRPRFWPLLAGRLEMDALELDQPRIELVRDRAGKWNFASLGQARPGTGQPVPPVPPVPPDPENPTGSSSSGQTSSPAMVLGRLAITDGRVAISSLAEPERRAEYDRINLLLTDFAPGKEFGLEAGILLPGEGKGELELKGTGGPLVMDAVAKTPFSGELTLKNTTLASLQAFSGKTGDGTDASLSGNLRIRLTGEQLSLDGKIEARDLKLEGKPLEMDLSADIGLKGDLTRQFFTLEKGAIDAGGVPLQLTGTLDAGQEPPRAAFQASMPDGRLENALKLATLFAPESTAGVKGTGRLSFTLTVKGALSGNQSLDIQGRARLQQAELQPPALTKPLRIRNTDVIFGRQSADFNAIDATLGRTTMKGTLSVRNFQKPALRFKLDLDKVYLEEMREITSGSDGQTSRNQDAGTGGMVVHAAGRSPEPMIERITGTGQLTIGELHQQNLVLTNCRTTAVLSQGQLKMDPLQAGICGGEHTGSALVDLRQSPPEITLTSTLRKVNADQFLTSVSDMKKMLTGMLATDLQTTFRTGEPEALLRSLNGKMVLNLTDAKMEGMDLMGELATVGKFLGGGITPRTFTSLVKLTGTFLIRNGVAETSDLVAQFGDGSLSAAGTIDLPGQAVNMHVLAVLSKAMSEKAGGGKVGGFMSTALANQNGELVIPVLVTGKLPRPAFAPDLKKMAELKLQQVLPSSGSLGQLAGGLMGLFGGRKNAPQPAEQPPPAGTGEKAGPAKEGEPAPPPANPMKDLFDSFKKKKKDTPPPATPPAKPPEEPPKKKGAGV